jgi:adenine-specific DNA-methyltransferase
VKLCALPAAIYDAYKKVLPKRKPKFLPEALAEVDGLAHSSLKGEQFFQPELNFDGNGGEL